MNKNDIQNAPKLFCESINIAHTPEYFVMLLRSGNQGQLYSLTPQHTKRLHQYLGYQLSEYEKDNRKIDASWDPKIVSPVQKINKPMKGS